MVSIDDAYGTIPYISYLISYNFTVPDQAGTYWYHSHYSTQYCDGLRCVNTLVLRQSELTYILVDRWSFTVCLYKNPGALTFKLKDRLDSNDPLAHMYDIDDGKH